MEPVAKVGGGPVGLALSLVLARYKVPTLVLEAREAPTPPASLGPSPGCPKGWSFWTGWTSGTISRGWGCAARRTSFGRTGSVY